MTELDEKYKFIEKAKKRMEETILAYPEIYRIAEEFKIPKEDYDISECFNPFRKAEVLIREVLRDAILKNYGCTDLNPYKYTKTGYIIKLDYKNEEIFKQKIEYALIQELGIPIKPPHYHYEWHEIVYWDLGPFNSFLKFCQNKCLIFPKRSCMIFPNEIELLKQNKLVITRYWSAIHYWLKGQFLGYKVDNTGCLLKIFAAFSD
jgi:hypothetical protein